MANQQVGRTSLSQQNTLKRKKSSNIYSSKGIPSHHTNVGLNNPTSLISINLNFFLLLNSLLKFVWSRRHK